MDIDSLRVIVTGAASGLGAYTCSALCREGAHVAAFDVDEKGLIALAESTKSGPGRLQIYRVNVAKLSEVAEAVAKVISDLGHINALINSAGIYRDGLLVKRVTNAVVKMPPAQWQAVIDVDLLGPFLMTREVAAHMVEKRILQGVIINISSVSRTGNAGQSNYSAAKAAIVASTRAWASELAEDKIRVAAIAPGFVRTPILDAMDSSTLESWVRKVPLRRLGEPSEIYAAIKFVLECEFFNGKCLEVDGGLSV